MGDNKISEAAVEAARDAYTEADTRGVARTAPMRIALEAALPHLHPQPAALNEPSGNSGELPPLPEPVQLGKFKNPLFTDQDMVNYARAALAATGKQQVGEEYPSFQLAGSEPLWCLHVLGMDDVHPAPSKAHAEKAAAWHNEQFKEQAARIGITVEAVVAPWPHSAESHAAGVADFIPEWLIPQWQLDALESKDAPPAQGIDLGPVRDLLLRRIAQWRSHLPSDPGAPGTVEISGYGEGGYNNDVRMYREGIAVMDEVLARIGQRDAAPGVGS